MSIIASPVLAATPLDIFTTASLEDLADEAYKQKLRPNSSTRPQGWGSVTDSEAYLDFSPQNNMPVNKPIVLAEDDLLPRRLLLRFYWTENVRRSGAPDSGGATWQYVALLRAVDVLIFETANPVTALIASRTPKHVKPALTALENLLSVVDEKSRIDKDITSRTLPFDFFLWLFYRSQTDDTRELTGHGLVLGEMQALSSTNANKAARFRGGASMDRIELVSLIAVSRGKFGPARFSVESDTPEATFDLELHLDGGFQPRRTSNYEEESRERGNKGQHLLEDIWVSVLPNLHSAYRADTDWDGSGRQNLIAQCLGAVQEALDEAIQASTALPELN